MAKRKTPSEHKLFSVGAHQALAVGKDVVILRWASLPKRGEFDRMHEKILEITGARTLVADIGQAKGLYSGLSPLIAAKMVRWLLGMMRRGLRGVAMVTSHSADRKRLTLGEWMFPNQIRLFRSLAPALLWALSKKKRVKQASRPL
ncbi:MAG: hypothetical protein JNM63_05440 [Spirochaetia bacterium]|nr:hypothetical protein [Spirochaetia bacterium]